MKSIISDEIRALAFDLDGTLYDEYDFVRQAYRPVSKAMAEATDLKENEFYESLCRSWMEYGSSAPVFQMAFEQTAGSSMEEELLRRCVKVYRDADFGIDLTQRTIDFLNGTKDYPKLIITDGGS